MVLEFSVLSIFPLLQLGMTQIIFKTVYKKFQKGRGRKRDLDLSWLDLKNRTHTDTHTMPHDALSITFGLAKATINSLGSMFVCCEFGLEQTKWSLLPISNQHWHSCTSCQHQTTEHRLPMGNEMHCLCWHVSNVFGRSTAHAPEEQQELRSKSALLLMYLKSTHVNTGCKPW